MILLTILVLLAIMLVMFMVLVLSIGGAGFIIIFGDVIVCIVGIAFIIKKLMKRRR